MPKLYAVNGTAGGARIWKIIDNDGGAAVNERVFEYLLPGTNTSSGILLTWPEYYYYFVTNSHWNSSSKVRTWYDIFAYSATDVWSACLIAKSNSMWTNHYPGEKYIQYSVVREYSKPSKGYTDYYFTNYQTNPDVADYKTSVAFQELYDVIPLSLQGYSTSFPGIMLNDLSGERGKPYLVLKYANNNGTFKKVEKIETEYTKSSDYQGQYIAGVRQTGCMAQSYKIYCTPHLPTKVTTTRYSSIGEDATVQQTKYEYNANSQVTKKDFLKSNQLWLTVNYTYPTDFVAQAPYTDMVNNRHIFSPVIEQTESVGTSILKSTKTNYFDWDNNIISPSTEEYKIGSNSHVKLRFHSYDPIGNIQTVSKENGTKITYLWGYSKTQPIAKVENAAFLSTVAQRNESSVQTSVFTAANNSLNGSFTLPSTYNNITLSISYNNLAGCPVQIKIDNIYIESTKYSPYSQSMTRTVSIGQLAAGIHSFYAEVSGQIPSNAFVNISAVCTKTIVTTYTDTYSAPFHTSFEEDNTNISTDYAKTGRKCHVGSYNLYIPAITSGTNQLIVSYWAKTSATADWVYIKETITASSNTIKSIGASYAYIDEVRVYPVDALMTTMTYKPLIGISSQTDPNNVTSFYEYDAFGHIQLIKRDDGKVLKAYEYQYKK